MNPRSRMRTGTGNAAGPLRRGNSWYDNEKGRDHGRLTTGGHPDLLVGQWACTRIGRPDMPDGRCLSREVIPQTAEMGQAAGPLSARDRHAAARNDARWRLQPG